MMKAYLEPEEVRMLEDATENLRDKLLIRTLFHLGCRVSEALALKVEDIDFTHGTVSIIHLKSRLKLTCANCGARLGLSHSFCPKCGAKIDETS
jgi:integrase/recombinase XerD